MERLNIIESTHATAGRLIALRNSDFATALGFPSNVEAAIDLLKTASVRLIDVGVVNGRHFVNVSGGGFIAEVSDAVDTQLKSVAGRLAYLIGGAHVLLTHEPFRTSITGSKHSCRFSWS